MQMAIKWVGKQMVRETTTSDRRPRLVKMVKKTNRNCPGAIMAVKDMNWKMLVDSRLQIPRIDLTYCYQHIDLYVFLVILLGIKPLHVFGVGINVAVKAS